MVAKFPEQQFILDHIAKPSISAPIENEWKANIAALSGFKNVSCKISGMVTEAEKFVFSEDSFTPFLDHVFSTFGPNRLLFGSDWPVCLLAADYSKVLAIIMDYLKQHEAETREKILGKNAQLIYNL
jgi:L-fuconolactonase